MKLKKRTWLSLSIIAATGLICAWWNACGGSDIVLSQQEMQRKIDARLPFVTKNDVTVSQAQLDLSADKIGLSVAASAKKLGQTYSIKAQTKGILRYDNDTGAFYFHPDELKISDVQVDGSSLQDKTSNIFDILVTSEKLRANKEAILGRAVTVLQGSVQKAAESTLEHTPVYRMPDNFKGNIARMALSSVEVKDGNIIAHVSFLQFSGMVIVYIGMFLGSLLVVAFLLYAAANGVALPFFL